MLAVDLRLIRSADGANGTAHRTAHTALPQDAGLNRGDRPSRAIRTGHIAPQHQLLDLATSLHVSGVDPGRLAGGGPLVVHQHRLADKQRSQPLQGLVRKPLMIPIYLIVAGCHAEGKNLLGCQLPQSLLVDKRQLRRVDRLFFHMGGL